MLQIIDICTQPQQSRHQSLTLNSLNCFKTIEFIDMECRDNNFMRLVKQRNPYLKRVASDTPHKYSYDIQSGKFYLLYQDGAETLINKIGTFNPKFRKKITGFASHKERYSAAKIDHTALHFTPDLTVAKNSYCTPMTSKFMGYAQQPYQIKGRAAPRFLSRPQEPHHFKKQRMAKSQSENKQLTKQNGSLILQHSTKTFLDEKTTDRYYQTSFMNMTDSKPLPKFVKKSCYNYRCRYLKHFVHDEKGKTEASTRFTANQKSINENTLSKSFYEKQFNTERKQLSYIQAQLT